MFLENSRYFKVPTVVAPAGQGRTAAALKLRPLEAPPGELCTVAAHERLDILAYHQYSDGTKFWHIADANTELEAAALVSQPGAALLKPKT
jgi:hypothetical protein